jgi:DNA anti-recombination protein RmuC
MLFSELLFALLLVFVLVLVSAVVLMVATINRRTEAQAAELSHVRAQLALGGQAQDSAVGELRERLGQAQALLEGMRAAVDARQQIEEDAWRSLRRLEAVVAGNPARGAAGENILEEALRHLPPDMVQRNVWVKGRVVEFGLRLPGGKLLPIDSKWTSGSALEEMALPDLEPARRAQLATQVEREVEKRAREVSQYIDPVTTAPFALAAVPDGAYATCRAAFAEAHRRNVILVGYSMALPYLLAVYQMHLQFARSVDMENLQACLMEVDRQLDGLEGALENKLQRAVTMLGNAYQDGKQTVARIRAAVQGIQASERLDSLPSLSVLDPATRAAGAGRPPVSLDADGAVRELEAVQTR